MRQCCEAGIALTSLPGPAACITALTISGLPTRRFCFEAFLPAEKKERQRILEELKTETRTIVLYEAPHRLVRTLRELLETLGDRQAAVCRELTKKHETALRTTLSEVLSYYEAQEPKGECVIVLAGRTAGELKKEEQEAWRQMSLNEHLESYLAQGLDRKEAMKRVAKDRGTGKREVYRGLLEEET